MKLGMIIYGSNGDVEMFVALALGFIKNKHQVNLFIITINDRDYSFLNEHQGLTVRQKFFGAEVRNEPTTNVEFWNERPEHQFTLVNNWYKLIVDDLVSTAHDYCVHSEMVIGPQHVLELSCIAEKYRVPYVSIRTFPGYIRSAFDTPFWASSELDKSIDELWGIYEGLMNKFHKRPINKMRKQLGLPAVTNVVEEVVSSKILNLISYSCHLHSKKPDWPSHTYLCGYFEAPDQYIHWELPVKLSEFIAGDEKPVLISLGTMLEYEKSKEVLHALLLRVGKQVNRKVIVHSAWGHDDMIEENVYKLSGFIAYPKLLRHCSLVVHHAGVGTAHIVTSAGCPSVVITYGFEQGFNAQALYQKGVSSGSIARAKLNAEDLLELINRALNDAMMKKSAEELGTLMKQEYGVHHAVQLVEAAYEKNYSSINLTAKQAQ